MCRAEGSAFNLEREQGTSVLASVNDLHVVVRAGFPFCVLVCHVASIMVDF